MRNGRHGLSTELLPKNVNKNGAATRSYLTPIGEVYRLGCRYASSLRDISQRALARIRDIGFPISRATPQRVPIGPHQFASAQGTIFAPGLEERIGVWRVLRPNAID
jgi:hypothetical protein